MNSGPGFIYMYSHRLELSAGEQINDDLFLSVFVCIEIIFVASSSTMFIHLLTFRRKGSPAFYYFKRALIDRYIGSSSSSSSF